MWWAVEPYDVILGKEQGGNCSLQKEKGANVPSHKCFTLLEMLAFGDGGSSTNRICTL